MPESFSLAYWYDLKGRESFTVFSDNFCSFNGGQLFMSETLFLLGWG